MHLTYKLTSIILIICMLFIPGCSSDKESEIKVALITDEGTIEDASFNEAAFNGMKQYCEEHGIKYSYFIPSSPSLTSYEEEMENAISKGAEILICPGYMLETAVFNESKKHEDIKFVLIDGEPHNEDYTDMSISENVLPILFAEDEAGFMAGYAAVRDGFTNLGFIGGMPEDPVIRYGYGFVQGADYAAIELGIKVYITYTYANTFLADENVISLAESIYNNGTDIIFACGGAMGVSVMKAAERCGKYVIGVDVDQSKESQTVVFSAVKNIPDAVYSSLNSYFSNTFKGGSASVISAADDGVGLSMESALYNKFSDIEYNAIYSELKNKKIQPYNNTDIGTTEELNFVNAEVTYIE